MLDIRVIREQADQIKERLATRGPDTPVELIDEILACDARRRASETRLQQIQSDRKRLSKEIGGLKAQGADTSAIEAQVRGFGEEMAALNAAATELDDRQRSLLLQLPNLPDPTVPAGSSAEENPAIREWGSKPAFGFEPADHIRLGQSLGLFDFERAARMSGSGFTCFTGPGARLERALIQFMLDLHTEEHGYTEIAPPLLVKPDTLIGTAQLPKFADQQYRIDADDLYLIPTAEVPVTNLYREEILRADELPVRMVSHTPCFRREAGAAGVGTRGLIRVHQFDKVELVKIAAPEASAGELESLTANAEAVLRRLGLHYRVIVLCTGDMGFGSAKTYDIEIWAPGQNAYLEVSSCTNFGDYQARRMNLRFKDAEGKNRFCHTLNGSGVACPRLFVALVESCQQADGSLHLPAALAPYFGSETISPKK
jgi:seryl-tRNA synthetase